MKLPVVAGAAPARDGRNLDPLRGILGGDGALQRVDPARLGGAGPAPGGLGEVPSRSVAETATYYGQAVLKESVWKWFIPAYLAVGGITGAAAALGAAAQLVSPGPGHERQRPGPGAGALRAYGAGRPLEGLIRRCRFVAAAGCAASAGLLIADLGRPARFLYMLRVFRPTSPMNLGTWILSAAGAASGAAAGLSLFPGRWARRGADLAGLAAGAAGLPLATYTAALLSHSAVPIWFGTRRSLPWLFAAGGAAGAAAVLELLPGTPAERRVAARLAAFGEAAELLATAAVEREARRQSGVARPLSEGRAGFLWSAARVATVASTLLSLRSGRGGAWRIAGALCGLAGSVTTRFAVVAAGRASSRDPLATFVPQREALELRAQGAVEGVSPAASARSGEPARQTSQWPQVQPEGIDSPK